MTHPVPITVCLLTRNEEAEIRGCLEALRAGFRLSGPSPSTPCDLLVVDTGSQDSTLEIARECGARVASIEWNDDFAQARNQAAELARHDWVMFVDADERLTPTDIDVARQELSKPHPAVYTFVQRNYTNDSRLPHWHPIQEFDRSRIPEGARGAQGYFDNQMSRLYNRRTEIVWEGNVHESLIPSARRLGLEIVALDVILHHYGKMKSPQTLEHKDTYYLKLSLEKIKMHPEDPVAWHEMGNNLAALERFKEAQTAFEHAYVLHPHWDLNIQNLALCLLHNEHYEAARSLLHQFLQSSSPGIPLEASLLSQLSTACLYLGDFGAARTAADSAITKEPSSFVAHLNLGILYAESQDFERSRFHFEIAASLDPTDTFCIESLEKVNARL